ncbi:MAG TPA: hypothetical protein DEB40_00575 [Elusimicrobia bacterium]|nr:hypothetical protein [Elusimicrobiota bacterium]HBT60222.1 hypothetical protein [Elusimicrobiota bacterium]
MSEPSAGNNPPSAWTLWADLAVLGCVWAFLLSQFPVRLLFSSAIATGGDTPAHYYTLTYLRQHLLPQGKLTGWCQANYAGFPMLEFYFPLPFLAMAAMSLAVSLPAAFKLGTLLGVFMLPPCAYLCLRLMRFPFPAPALGAVAVLPFLFMEANSFWGGNILSTLAGEFAYGVAMALAALWLGVFHRGMTTGRGLALSAGLLSLIGLSHGYALLFAGAWSIAALIRRETFGTRLAYFAWTHLLAILLMAFWLIPLIAHLPWTTSYDFMLPASDFTNFLPAILAPQILLAAYACGWEPNPSARYLAAAAAAGLLLWLVGPSIGVVDFRFLPFCQLAIALLSAVGLALLTRRLRGQILIPFLALSCALLWIQGESRNMQSWAQWNYSGFEGKQAWPTFAKINAALSGTVAAPRVVYEHSSEHNDFGTVRAWECLPAFSGRSTLEHAYFQASPTAPFVFYIQSEISDEISCPFPSYGCASLDLARARRHLDMFNVSEFIAVGRKVKAALKRASGFKLKAAADPYEVYELEGPHAYVVPLAYEPVLWTGPGSWKEAAYTWFRHDRSSDVHLVFPVGSRGEDFARFRLRANGFELPRQKLSGPASVVSEKLTDDAVEFETEALGKPHLIKVSFHPDWKVEGADRIYLASPAFMLVYPNQRKVRLSFARSWAEKAGLALSLLGLCLAALLALGKIQAWPRTISRKIGNALWLSFLLGGLSLTFYWTFDSWHKRLSASDAQLAKAAAYEGKKDWESAEKIYARIASQRPVSRFAEQARFRLGMNNFVQDRFEPASAGFKGFLEYFPDSPLAAEAFYHLGLCYERLDNTAQARSARDSLMKNFPDSMWARQARAQKDKKQASAHGSRARRL